MRIAVLSDIHDNLSGLKKVLALLPPLHPEILILCGDLTRPTVLDLCAQLALPVHFCLGNCDAPHESALNRAALASGQHSHSRLGTLPTPQGTIAFTHYPAEANSLARSGLYRAVFYGHTHRPGASTLSTAHGHCLLANPGDIEGRYGRIGGLVWDSLSGAVEWVEA